MAAPNTSTALATRPRAIEGVVEYKPTPMQQKTIDILASPSSMAVIGPLIPKGVAFDEVAIEVYRAATKVPGILECTPNSIVMAVADCLRVGLIIGKTIHLVPVPPRRGEQPELQAWTDYKGDIELVVAAGAARHIEAHAVYEADRFEAHLGSDPHIVHVPELIKARGKVVAYYAVAFINNTLRKVCVMRVDEVEAIRAKSRQWNPNKVPQCPEWYGLKTAIHRICKDLPKNSKLARLMSVFDRQDATDRGGEEEAEYTIVGAPSAAVQREPEEARAQANPDDDAIDVSDMVEEEESPVEDPAASHAVPDGQPSCPTCSGPMWDNRLLKKNPKAPDYKCKNRGCDGVYWPGAWPPAPPASDAQRAQMLELASSRDLNARQRTALDKALNTADKPLNAQRAQEWIDRLKELPEKTAEQTSAFDADAEAKVGAKVTNDTSEFDGLPF